MVGLGARSVDPRVPTGKGTTERLFTGPSVDRDARVSPDGMWVAYVSHEARTVAPHANVSVAFGSI